MDRHFWSTSWAADSCSISQQIIHASQKLRIPYGTDKSLTPEKMPNRILQVNVFPSSSFFFFSHFNTDLRKMSRSSIPARGERYFFSPKHQNLFWGPPSILCFGYQDLLLRQQSGHGVKLTLQTSPSAYSENVWIYTSIPPHAIMASFLIRHWEIGESRIW